MPGEVDDFRAELSRMIQYARWTPDVLDPKAAEILENVLSSYDAHAAAALIPAESDAPTLMSNALVIVTEADRDLRQKILNFIVLCLDRPCGSGDMPDDRNDGLDQIIARHRLNATTDQSAEIARLRAALETAQSALWQYIGDLKYPPNADSLVRRIAAAEAASDCVDAAIAQQEKTDAG